MAPVSLVLNTSITNYLPRNNLCLNQKLRPDPWLNLLLIFSVSVVVLVGYIQNLSITLLSILTSDVWIVLWQIAFISVCMLLNESLA